MIDAHALDAMLGAPAKYLLGRTRTRKVRISANVTADFGNVTDSAGFGVARCRL